MDGYQVSLARAGAPPTTGRRAPHRAPDQYHPTADNLARTIPSTSDRHRKHPIESRTWQVSPRSGPAAFNRRWKLRKTVKKCVFLCKVVKIGSAVIVPSDSGGVAPLRKPWVHKCCFSLNFLSYFTVSAKDDKIWGLFILYFIFSEEFLYSPYPLLT